ncbi:MAG: hypothetical protein ACYS9X_12035 [Planctomycetota bacterium]|jgi:hypothetical protein
MIGRQAWIRAGLLAGTVAMLASSGGRMAVLVGQIEGQIEWPGMAFPLGFPFLATFWGFWGACRSMGRSKCHWLSLLPPGIVIVALILWCEVVWIDPAHSDVEDTLANISGFTGAALGSAWGAYAGMRGRDRREGNAGDKGV